MTVGVIRNRIFSALAIALLVLGGFLFGFVSRGHLKRATSNDVRQQFLLPAGDAPPAVRAGVLAALRSFQEGYVKRDPKELNLFMHRLFPENDDILVLGTAPEEWARGYPAAAEFIRTDWQMWGDVRLAVDDSIISSSGDVAWIATVGVVHIEGSDRPVRFSAILARNGGDWLFRQVQFQYDDRDPRASDLLRASTQLQLVKWVLHIPLRSHAIASVPSLSEKQSMVRRADSMR